MLKSVILCISICFVGQAQCRGQESGENPEPVDQFAGDIRPLLDRYCMECHAHGGNKAEFLWPKTEADAVQLRNSFASVLQRMEVGTMPPEDSDQPSEVERKQIKKWIDETFDLKPADFDRISDYVVESFEDSNGNLWFGTVSDGAVRYNGKAITWFTTRNGLGGNTVVSIAEDKQGNIWIGCLSSDHPEFVQEGGLNRFDGRSFARFPKARGLFETDIYTIHPTRSGDVWIGATGVGAYRFDGSTFALFDETDRPYWTRYFGVQSMLQDRNGTLWFGFSGGLFRFNGKSFSNVGKAGPWGAEMLNQETGKQEADEESIERRNLDHILDAPQD